MAHLQQTRSSSPSTLSCITVRDESGDVSSTNYSTPPTSNPDALSTPAENDVSDILLQIKGRPLRARRSLNSYNESILAGTAKKSVSGRTTNISCATDKVLTGDQVDLNTIAGPKVLDSIRRITDDSPKEVHIVSIEKVIEDPLLAAPHRRRSTRLSLAARATERVVAAKDGVDEEEGMHRVLGKRKRKAMFGNTRSSTRSKAEVRCSRQGNKTVVPTDKRRRVSSSSSSAEIMKDETTTSISEYQRVKRWLACGLYVGQDSNTSPRAASARRRSKYSLPSAPNQRKFLPLPMFTGKRVVENGRDFRLPFDVFSPLPPGQPKPEEWRRTRKNVFIGEAANIWKKHKVQELSRCICTPETGCGENCQNRFMFYECDETNCNIGAEYCTNRNFQALKQRCKSGGKYHIGVEVIKTADRGYGVRSNRTFEPNQIIVEYAGEIITQDECEKRMKNEYKNNECYYLMLFDQNMIIDASRGSIARFVNHSCQPNCSMVKWTVAGKPRMALFAGERGVMTGEELTYDYNFDPFSVKNVQQCRCGASNCRGVLGPRSKEQFKPNKEKGTQRSCASSMKRKFVETSLSCVKGQPSKARRAKGTSLACAEGAGLRKSAVRPRNEACKNTVASLHKKTTARDNSSISSAFRARMTRPDSNTRVLGGGQKKYKLASHRAPRTASKAPNASREPQAHTRMGSVSKRGSRNSVAQRRIGLR
ncbi:SET domain-containing protein [Xylona heveae TC161]|uniref:SET domain-containing protein n=1 Tax=Xylona heveae (strain CBS 132557 / TC161) TaxID=1328760 RepID=A0A165AI77_XYLHT|nr:SET domain-containing protein [Xylona heveae TC161]KZF20518.1 SET domain-containing protein [Xylona heveae TC161]